MLAAKAEADTSYIEEGVEWIVCNLYGLTEEEEDAAIGQAMHEARDEMEQAGERGDMEDLRKILKGWDESGT